MLLTKTDEQMNKLRIVKKMETLRNLEFVLRNPAPDQVRFAAIDSERSEAGWSCPDGKTQSFRSFRVNILAFHQTCSLLSVFSKKQLEINLYEMA